MSEQDTYEELCCYTIEHARTDSSFIHQSVVDAWAAQHAGKDSKPITVAFALIGLYLSIEKNYSGRQVQLAHMQLAKKRKHWPAFSAPPNIGEMAVFDVMQAKPGADRDQAIRKWAASVWKAWHESHAKVADLVQAEFGFEPEARKNV